MGIALGDFFGKGIAAALMIAILEASLRAEAMRGTDDLAALVQNVNRLVYEGANPSLLLWRNHFRYAPKARVASI